MLRPILLMLFICISGVASYGQGYSGLVARWPFNGNADDVSGNGLNGVVHNAVLDTGITGLPNTAYRFNGTSSTITIPYNSLMNTKPHSFCALVKPAAFYSGSCQGNAILWRGRQWSSDFSYQLEIFDNAYDNSDAIFSPDHEVFAGWTGRMTSATPQTEWYYTPTVQLNRWYAVVLTYDGDTTKVYVDGSLVSTFYNPCTFTSTTDSLSIGKGQDGPSYPYWFNGVIDEIRFYNRPLTATEALSFSDSIAEHSAFPIKFFLDANGNGIKDIGEKLNTLPLLVAIDSNGMPVDTISATSGAYIPARGNAGDVYSFRVISSPSGLFLSSPLASVIYDTISTSAYATKYFGFSCYSLSSFDLQEAVSATTDINGQTISAVLNNSYCSPIPATFRMTFSPRFNFSSATPAPTSVSGNTITWDLGSLSYMTSPIVVRTVLRVPGAALTPGDTVNTICSIDPTAGDVNASNNMIIRNDTVRLCYDPNEITVVPATCLPRSVPTEMQYTIHFENTGNDTAHNIYILDVLSNNLDSRSLSIVAASAPMNTKQFQLGGTNIVKFEFPGINLLDSSYHDQCTGFVTYKINTISGLSAGATITNRADIYFDANAPVSTNTAESVVCRPVTVHAIETNAISASPNPVSDQLTVSGTQKGKSLQILDCLGRMLGTYQASQNETVIPVETLPSGLYIIKIEGATVTKFIKQ